MADKYNSDILRVAVAQICQTIGYNNSMAAPLELLQDVLHKFLVEFSRDLHIKAEHANRTEPNFKDLFLSMKSLSIDFGDLLGYISSVESVPFAFDIPKYPARKNCNLNFLKPGNKEILSRPVHIYGYLPPMLQTKSSHGASYNNNIIDDVEINSSGFVLEATNKANDAPKKFEDLNTLTCEQRTHVVTQWPVDANLVNQSNAVIDDNGVPTREISSVVMTSSGFISPAIEGKQADARIPDIIDRLQGLDAPPALPVAQPTTSTLNDNKDHQSTTMIMESLVKPDVTTKDKSLFENDIVLSTVSQDVTQSKHIKKGKKKQGNIKQNLNPDLLSKKINVKTHRKAIKMLHKLSKSVKNVGMESSLDINDIKRTFNDKINPDLIASLPVGSNERLQLEKLFKKQVKQKQKILKQRIAKELPIEQKGYFKNCGIATQVEKQSLTLQPLKNLEIGSLNTDTQSYLTKSPRSGTSTNTLCLPITTNMNTYVQKNLPQVAINTMTQNKEDDKDVKLSNEPNRSKLNIFKKISKPKGSKLVSINAINSLQSDFSSPHLMQPLINLPSGTTITPTLVSPPKETENSTFIDRSVISKATNLPLSSITSSLDYGEISNTQACASPNELTKPKKRGRKPGSKNQIKNFSSSRTSFPKKAKPNKRFNLDQNLVNSDNLLTPNEPLNLTNVTHTNTSLIHSNLQNMCNQQENVTKPRKERKKYKSKYNPLGLSPCDSTLSECRTIKEHVESNNKILAMDTVLKSSIVHTGDYEDLTKSLLVSPSNSKSPNFKKQRLSPKKSSSNVSHSFVSPAERLTVPSQFHNKNQNFMPLMPLYPFPSRPGLIPTGPGFYPPSGIASFPANTSGVTHSNLLLSSFLPFTNISQTYNGKVSFQENENKSAENMEVLVQQTDRKFNNVTPINSNLREAIRPIPQSHLLPNTMEPIKIDSLASFRNFESSEISNTTSKIAPNQPGGNLKYFIDSLTRTNNLLPTATGNADDPIEVSDDSGDTPNKIEEDKVSPGSATITSFRSNLIQPIYLPNTPLTNSDNKISPNMLPSSIKFKKSKLYSNLTPDSAISHPSFNLELKCSDKLSLAGGADLIPLSRTQNVLTYPGNIGVTSSIEFLTQTMPKNSTSQIFEGVTITPANPSFAIDLKKRKEHKKVKKLKEGKIKKKKDKKDKSKNKDRFDDKHMFKPQMSSKEIEKKLRKEKKREKQRLLLNTNQFIDKPVVNTISEIADSNINNVIDLDRDITFLNPEHIKTSKTVFSPNHVPKITLKIGGNSKPSTPQPEDGIESKDQEKRAQTPELARFSPLVTRPPKPKQYEAPTSVILGSNSTANEGPPCASTVPTPTTWPPGGTISASSVLLPQQLINTSKHSTPSVGNNSNATCTASKLDSTQTLPQVPETNRPSSYVDDDGNTIWICPACGKVDDGSAMIGCDGCDAWYHWLCVGLIVAPKDNEDWFCRVCITRKKVHGSEKKRKRNKKK